MSELPVAALRLMRDEAAARAGCVQAPPEPRRRAGAALAHERGAVSEPAPTPTPDPGGFVRVVIQKAPDLHGGAILTAFGAVVTVWLLSVPPDDVSLYLSILLPPLFGYEIGAQCAGKAPPGRE